MGEPIIQRSFAGGELAPALHARADLGKYLTGLRTCRNFLVERQGGVSNRAGFRFVAPCRAPGPAVMLLRYVSEIAGESVLIEAGQGYLRFFKDGAPVTIVGAAAWSGGTPYVAGDVVASGGVNYYARIASSGQAPPNATYWYAMPGSVLEVPHPFVTAELFHWTQSGRVITLTHTAMRPHELHYLALTRWVLVPVNTAPGVAAPTGLNVVMGAPGTLTYSYKVTAGQDGTYEESTPSAQFQVTNILEPTKAAPNVLTWTPVAGAAEYYVYLDPYGNGTFGFIGTAAGAASFRDIGLVPDFQVTPPLARILFQTTDNYPSRCAHYQQRRLFAYTNNDPDAIWGSRVGFPSNFTISSPLQDDDAITFRIVGDQHNPVRHLLGLKTLIVLTDAGEWTVGIEKTPLTPSDIPADQETYVGVSGAVKPVVVGNSILYVQARGSVLRDLRFDQEVEGLGGRDLTLFAAHLFDGYTIRGLDYAQTPDSTVWAVRSDGVLLGLTYIREQDVWGWHRHDTGAHGFFWDVCVVPEPGADAVYVIVRRTIGGETVRYIERLASRAIYEFDRDCFFVDAGLSYAGEPQDQIAGLEHLEGEIVAVVGDGGVVFDGNPAAANADQFRVTGGTLPVALPASYIAIHAGLPIRHAEIETLDLDVAGSAIRDQKKKVTSLSLLLDRSSRTVWAGPDAAHLTQQTLEPWQEPTDEHSGIVELSVVGTFTQAGRVLIRQTDPLPLTILGVLPNVTLGG